MFSCLWFIIEEAGSGSLQGVITFSTQLSVMPRP